MTSNQGIQSGPHARQSRRQLSRIAPIRQAYNLRGATAQDALRTILTGLIEDGLCLSKNIRKSQNIKHLHDLRVVLRKLRGIIKLHADWIQPRWASGTVEKLKKLCADTNILRDAQVELVLLKEFRPKLSQNKLVIVQTLHKQLSATVKKGYSRLRGDFLSKFEVLAQKILFELDAGIFEPSPEPYDRILGIIVKNEARNVRKALVSADKKKKSEAIHRARIKARRLRYILEIKIVPRTQNFKKRLVKLQGILGAVHDMEVFIDKLNRIGRTAKRQRGYKTLKSLMKSKEKDAYKKFRQAMCKGKFSRSFGEVLKGQA